MFYYNEGVPDQQYAAGQWDNGYGQYGFPQDNSVGHEFAANNGYAPPMDTHPGYVDYSYRNNGPRNHDPYHHGGGSRGMGGHYRDSHQRGFRQDAYSQHQPHAAGGPEAGYGEYGYHNGQQHQAGPPQQSYYENRSYHDQGRGGGGGGGGGYQGNQGYRSNNGYRPEGAPIGYGSRDSSTDNFGANLPTIQWDLPSLPHFEKNFYNEHPDVTARTEQSAVEWRTDNQISIIGEGIPKPVLTFEEASMPEFVLAQVRKQGFVSPSPIQSQGWPMALLGRDMIGISATGSGKTLAFLLPALVHIKAQPRLQRGDGPLVLVLAPTRELGMQIKQECDKMSGQGHIRNAVVYGGVAKHSQVRDLKNGVEILIATPGRLIDHLETNVTNLRRVTYLVLDEADRMLDMGFEPQIRKLVSQIRPDRQTLLWSATWPKEVQQLARDLLSNPYEVHVGSLDLRANKAIKQYVEVVSDFEKYGRMTHHLDQYTDGSKVLIFVETKKGCDILARSLQNQNYRCGCIHGDKSQRERDQTLAEFKNGRVPIMVATDVAARGLDVKDVRIVINFDMPNSIEDYVHRIGRTGRAGAMGVAVSFFTDKAGKMARDLVKVLYEAGQEVPPELSALVQQSGRHGHGGGYRGGRFGGRGGGYSHGGRGGGRFFHHGHHSSN